MPRLSVLVPTAAPVIVAGSCVSRNMDNVHVLAVATQRASDCDGCVAAVPPSEAHCVSVRGVAGSDAGGSVQVCLVCRRSARRSAPSAGRSSRRCVAARAAAGAPSTS